MKVVTNILFLFLISVLRCFFLLIWNTPGLNKHTVDSNICISFRGLSSVICLVTAVIESLSFAAMISSPEVNVYQGQTSII